MKTKLILTGLLLAGAGAYAQQADLKNIAATNPPDIALAPLRYLASDELKGRNIERPEINTAAQYIADQFKAAGAKPMAGATGYFQMFSLRFLKPSTNGTVNVGAATFKLGADAIQALPQDIQLKAPVVYAGKGTKQEIAPLDVKGKIVLVDIGKTDQNVGFTNYEQLAGIQSLVAEKGGLGLIERWDAKDSYWAEIREYLMASRPADTTRAAQLPTVLINTAKLPDDFTKATAAAGMTVSGTKVTDIALKNVMAYVPGTDASMRAEYVLLSSHYDHLGVAAKPKMEEGKLDSIYNGARDNASGTTAIIDAARYFAKYPAKRSILFIAYTAEEEGLLGSIYYAAHPVTPLKQIVYNLNIDNASYNDTTLISLVGIGRTSADPLIVKACRAYGLHIGGDPTGGQLFSGSDNYPLAGKGIPAPTFSLGMKTFDETITNRYHQLSDEVGNMDLNYMMKFIGSYILAAQYIANDPMQPRWTAKDEYENAWNQLFSK